MSAEQQTITNDTIMMGVVCKKCKKTLPDHTVKTHLEDPTNSIFKCPSHKPKREGFKWGKELFKWKVEHAELQKKYDDLVEKTLEENEGFLGEVRKSGYKDGHSDGYMEAREEIKNLKAENEEWNRQLAECELVPKENVLCSYDDVNDFIWNRVKDICREDIPPKYQPLFDGNDFIREFKGVPELKKENEELRLEIENLKTELAGDDSRMDKMEQERIQEVQKLRAEIEDVRKDAYKDGRRNGYMERATEYEKTLKELARK
jgi:hypothetical protein